MPALRHRFPTIPDVFYLQRIKHQAESGVVETNRSLNRMRYSEIPLAGSTIRKTKPDSGYPKEE